MLDRQWLVIGSYTALTLFVPVVARAQAARLLVPAESRPETPATSDISTLELQQFAQAVRQLQSIEMESQKQMAKIIEKGGLKPERFLEIDRAASGGPPPANPISDSERQKYTEIVPKIQKVARDAQPKKERAIGAQGLTVSRFGQINSQVRNDRSLQEKIKQMLGAPVS